jgi:hypothetical protein
VPFTGKTLLGNWLQKNCGYIHIDAERENGVDLDDLEIHDEWNRFVFNRDTTSFMEAVERLKKPVALNWGFPAEFIHVPQALREQGFGLWWFDAKRSEARQAFINREGKKPKIQQIPVEKFDEQMEGIEAGWSDIEPLFKGNFIQGLDKSGQQREAGDLWKEISATKPSLRVN